jgi:hypothetical protein
MSSMEVPMHIRSSVTVSAATLALVASVACGDSFHDTQPTGTGGSAGTVQDASPGDDASGSGGASETGGSSGAGGAVATGGTSGGETGGAGTGGSGGGCAGATADCDNDPGNGCETAIDTVDNCGSCGAVCPSADHATATCESAKCGLQCMPGYGDCDNDPGNGCETAIDTVDNCGSCGAACPSADHATATCENATCGLQCTAGYGDCDNDPGNGCETAIDSVDNCGACGTVCSAAQHATATCEGGTQCGYACETSYLDCDQVSSNGCEVNKQSDVSNCGACGNKCTAPSNATAKCTSGACGFTCKTGFGNCNNQTVDGCEVDLTKTVEHCGACGQACPTPSNATPTCQASTCGFTCNAGYDDCDHNAGTGCEKQVLGTDIHNCGACGKECGTANGTPKCTAGVCSITCSSGYDDCNGKNADGCEVNLKTDAHNCGSCGHDCGGGSCSNGYCTAWLLAQETDAPRRITQYGDTVYWTLSDAIRRVSKSGGAVTSVQTGLTNAVDLAADATMVYWIETGSPGKVRKSLRTGGTITDVAKDVVLPRAIAVDDSFVYWATDTEVWKRGKSALIPVNLVTGASALYALHVGSGRVYFSSFAADGYIRYVPTTGGAVKDVVLHQNAVWEFGLDANGGVYFSPNSGKLLRVSSPGSSPVELATGLTPTVMAFAVDGSSVFVAEPAGKVLAQYPINGGAGVVRFTGDAPLDVTADDTTVYFIASGKKSIYAMVK